MSNLRILSYRAGVGLVLGTAAGIALYVLYKQRWRKGFWRQNYIDDVKIHTLNSSPLHREFKDTSLQQNPGETPVLVEACNAVFYSSPACGKEMEILERLDFVLKSIVELRQEVGELRNNLQGLAVEIVGQVKSHIAESQKVNRRRRFLFHRERSDSTGSSSIYFTAASGGVPTDEGESEGGYTTANPESDYDRESDRASEEDEASCETVKTVRRDSMDLVSDEEVTLTFDPLEDEDLALLQNSAEHKHDGEMQDKTERSLLLLSNTLKSFQTDEPINGLLEYNPVESKH